MSKILKANEWIEVCTDDYSDVPNRRIIIKDKKGKEVLVKYFHSLGCWSVGIAPWWKRYGNNKGYFSAYQELGEK